MIFTKAVVAQYSYLIHFIEEGPDIVVEGARLPSILRLASCLSSSVTCSSFFGISGACCNCSGE